MRVRGCGCDSTCGCMCESCVCVCVSVCVCMHVSVDHSVFQNGFGSIISMISPVPTVTRSFLSWSLSVTSQPLRASPASLPLPCPPSLSSPCQPLWFSSSLTTPYRTVWRAAKKGRRKHLKVTTYSPDISQRR